MPDARVEADAGAGRFALWLGLMLAVGMGLRLGYVWFQSSHDPWLHTPMLDGAYYIEWARAVAAGKGAPSGAFYLAPLYPTLLAAWFRLFGDAGFPQSIFVAQQLLSVASAGLIGYGWRREIGAAASLSAAGLFLLYPPLWFFASVPLGETLGIFLATVSLFLVRGPSATRIAAAGASLGAAILVRPNFLLVALIWCAGFVLLRQGKRGLLFIAMLGVVLAPVAIRNFAVSGHLVLVSSNAGITSFHGNGPGADGRFTLPARFSTGGGVAAQRAEATALARQISGKPLDEVEADRWWGRQARKARLADPAGSISLLWRRVQMLLDNHEHGLDYPPALDANPLQPALITGVGQRVAVVPFALLLGLAVGSLIGRSWDRLPWTWAAILCCAATPVLFYVSSRYRLPCAALLALPAGCGLADLLGFQPGLTMLRRSAAATAVLLTLGFSFFAPEPLRLLRQDDLARGLTRRAGAQQIKGSLEQAELDVRAAIELQPGLASAQNRLGLILVAQGRPAEGEVAFRRALDSQPEYGPAAINLSHALSTNGRHEEAIVVLRRLLEARPLEPTAWGNLIVNLQLAGRNDEARFAVREAIGRGVALDPGLVAAITGGATGE